MVHFTVIQRLVYDAAQTQEGADAPAEEKAKLAINANAEVEKPSARTMPEKAQEASTTPAVAQPKPVVVSELKGVVTGAAPAPAQ